MTRAALTQDEITSFRGEICEAATRLFAEHGYGGVTLRAISAEVGCSPMTPYRYFADKNAIFTAVRAAAFERFTEALRTVPRNVKAEHQLNFFVNSTGRDRSRIHRFGNWQLHVADTARHRVRLSVLGQSFLA